KLKESVQIRRMMTQPLIRQPRTTCHSPARLPVETVTYGKEHPPEDGGVGHPRRPIFTRCYRDRYRNRYRNHNLFALKAPITPGDSQGSC
ncbi:MAG: hypothetical protein VX757_01615, partial [Planctomycetota bacterium]|nr:hypothetical protein [Planctomycetota bacterium]